LISSPQVGDIIGSKSWQESGKQEHAKGEGEYNAARATDYVKGAGDRVKGMKDAVIGSLTGDKTQQAQGKFLFHSLMTTVAYDNFFQAMCNMTRARLSRTSILERSHLLTHYVFRR